MTERRKYSRFLEKFGWCRCPDGFRSCWATVIHTTPAILCKYRIQYLIMLSFSLLISQIPLLAPRNTISLVGKCSLMKPTALPTIFVVYEDFWLGVLENEGQCFVLRVQFVDYFFSAEFGTIFYGLIDRWHSVTFSEQYEVELRTVWRRVPFTLFLVDTF